MRTAKYLLSYVEKPAAIVASDGSVVFCNKAFARLTNRKSSEILRSSLFDLFDRINGQILKNQFLASRLSRRQSFELRYGEYYAIKAEINPYIDEEGYFRFASAIFDDSKNKTRIGARLFEKFYDLDNTPSAIIDRELTIHYANDAFANKFEFPKKAEAIGKKLDAVLAKGEAKKVGKLANQISATRDVLTAELYGRTVLGEVVPLELSIFRLSDKYFGARFKNLAAEKAESPLVDKYLNVFENAPVSILLVDPDTLEIVESNKAARKILGYSFDSDCGVKFNDLILSSFDVAARTINSALDEGGATLLEKCAANSGEFLYFSMDIYPVSSKGKRYAQIICSDVTELKKKTLQLIESETRYRILVENNYDAIVIADDEKILYANKRASLLTSIKLEELIGAPLCEIFSPYERERIRKILRHLERKELPLRLETKINDADGAIIDVEMAVNSIPMQGKLVRLLEMRDIRYRKRIEKAYRSLVENSLFGYAIYKNYKPVYVNKRFCELTGYDETELLAMKEGEIFELVPESERDFVRKATRLNLIKKRPVESFVHRVISKDGKIRTVEATATPIEFEGGLALQVAYSDVTERYEALKKLEDSEKRFRALVENAFDAIFTLKGTKIEYANPMFSRITGYAASALKKGNLDFLELIYEDSLPIFEKSYAKIIAGDDAPKAIQIRIKRKKGNVKYVDIHFSLLKREENNEPYLLAVMRDATERARREQDMNALIVSLHIAKKIAEDRANEIELLNQKLRESEAKLREINANKDKFFSIIAHDLRGPFSGFLGLTKILSQDIESLEIEDIRDIANDLKQSAEGLYELLENLLQWSRIQRKTIEFRPDEVDLRGVADINIRLLSANAKQKNIELINEIGGGVLAFGDVNLINLVFRNLLSNAVKFTFEGGKVVVSARYVEDDLIEVRVSDTGRGIDEKTLKNLFNVAFNKSSAGTANEKGSGIGLVLCKEIVEMSGGEIWAESELGKGSTFYFTLPRAK